MYLLFLHSHYSEMISTHGIVALMHYQILNTFFLKHSCNPVQSTTTGLNDSYHNLTSLVRVKQNLCTFATPRKLCVSIQSFVLNRCASTSSSGFPENSGLKYDHFNCVCTGLGIWAGEAGGNAGLGT